MTATYQLVTNMHNNVGNYFTNVFHYELSESGSGVTPFEYADRLISAWVAGLEAKYLDLLGSDVAIDFYTAKKVNNGGGPTSARQSGNFGTGALSSSSSGAAGDVQWQSASPLNRPGHTYLAAFPYSFLQGDIFQSGYTNKVGIWITQMILPLTLAGALGSADFTLFTRKTNTNHVIVSGQLRPKATMMNRRLLPQI